MARQLVFGICMCVGIWGCAQRSRTEEPASAGERPVVFTIARDGMPAATIVIAKDAGWSVKFAAEELREHVQKITGARLSVVDDEAPASGPRILVGESAATRALGLVSEQFKSQEYLIRIGPDALILIGCDGCDDGETREARHRPKWVDGKFGKALQFDGVDDYVAIPDCGFNDAQGSLEAWVYLPAQPQQNESTILRLDGRDPWTYHIIRRWPATSAIGYSTYDGQTVSTVSSGEIEEGWHHILATHDAGRGAIELFIDGVSQGLAKFTRSTCAGAALSIGGMTPETSPYNTIGNPFAGIIDEVRVSDVVRSPQEIDLSRPCIDDANTVLLLHMDEGRGILREFAGKCAVQPPNIFDANGSLYAVYDFLERFCDVRWYAPGDIGVVHPTMPTLSVYGPEVRRVPAMVNRWITPCPLFLPTPAERIPERDAHIWKLRMRLGGQNFWACHSFYGYYDRFLKQHPDWFAQGYEGQPPQMCYTNEGFIRQVIQDARDYFDGKGVQPGAIAIGDFFALVPQDNDFWCKCPRCQAEMDRAEMSNEQFNNGQASNYIWGFVNKVAKEVRKTHPDKFISALAYSTYAYYPDKVELEPNIAVQLCLHTRNWWTPSMERNDMRVLGDWVSKEGKRRPVYLWLYYNFPAYNGLFEKYGVFPGFFAHTVARQMKLYHELGIRGIFAEHSSEFNHSWLLDQLEFYVTWKLADDPTLDGDKLIAEFFRRYYGAAAEPMQKLYESIENTFSDPNCYPEYIQRSAGHRHQNEELAWKYLGTEERMAHFASLMAEAKNAARTEIERQRVALFERGVWMPMVEGRKRYVQKSAQALEIEGFKSQEPPSVKVPRLQKPSGGDPASVDWSKAVKLGEWRTVTGYKTDRRVETWLAHDGDFLYVRLEEAIDTARLVSKDVIWSGDDWELFFSARRERPYRQFAVNPNGKTAALAHGETEGWDSGARVVSDTKSPDRWVVQIAFPLANLIPGGVKPGGKFYANFYRASAESSDLLAWSPNFEPTFQTANRLGEITLE